MANIVKFGGGGGGASKPPVAVIVVTAPTGSAVTAVCGGKSYTAAEHDGRWGIYVDALGTYTVTATRGTDSDTATVEVTQEGGVYSVTLSYSFTVTITGSGGRYGYVQIGGTKYSTAATVQVSPGTDIALGITGGGSSGAETKIIVNGATISNWVANTAHTYTIIPNTDCTIVLSINGMGGGSITATYPTTATQALQIENAGLKAALHTLGVDTGEVGTM